jgi:hypothetical protein
MADKLVEMPDEPASPVAEAAAQQVAELLADVDADAQAAAAPEEEEHPDPALKPAAAQRPIACEELPAAPEEEEGPAAAPDAAVDPAAEEPAAEEEEPAAEEEEAAADEAEPEQLSNEDVIAGFLEANASGDAKADSSVVHHDATSSLIVEGSSELSGEPAAANGTSRPADLPEPEEGEGEGKDSVSGVSARIKRLSSMFEAVPEAGTASPPGRVGVPIGRVKHSFGGASESASRMSATGAADRSQPLISMLVSAVPWRARCSWPLHGPPTTEHCRLRSLPALPAAARAAAAQACTRAHPLRRPARR